MLLKLAIRSALILYFKRNEAVSKEMRLQFLLTFDPLTGDARHLRQECYTSQRLRSERDSNLTYIMRADHEFYCSNTAPINHKVTAGDVNPLDDTRF